MAVQPLLAGMGEMRHFKKIPEIKTLSEHPGVDERMILECVLGK
jgi:hypothetical protein